jgi:N utilization substance protein B
VKARRHARAIALQALYEIDSVQHDAEAVLQHRLNEKSLPQPGEEFARRLLFGVLQHQAELDDIIQQIAPEWPIDQIAVIDRNILRLAVFELVIDRQTPMKVAINEAVELAKLFGSDSSRRFVNGALGTLVAQKHLLDPIP